MRKYLSILFLLFFALSAMAGSTLSTPIGEAKQQQVLGALPVSVPSVGDADLIVMAQNLRNYFYHYASSDRSECTDEACYVNKTSRIVDVVRATNADIVAFCELEANDDVLRVLTDSLNLRAGTTLYAYVKDGISDDGYSFIKSGFVYRTDKVKPVGANNASSTQAYYQYTMRWQRFEELTSGEQFVLSMNHFKAKDNTEDMGNAKRVRNANDLVAAMGTASQADPDVLILGDLNCEVGEEPLQIISQAGYVEQLLRFTSSDYSHCYGGGTLIDHVYANASMQKQITGAAVYHISTSCATTGNVAYRYSDHDPYLVGLKLASTTVVPPTPDECEDMNYTESFYSNLGGFTSVNVSGTNNWYVDATYHYAKINGTASDNNEGWLISPALNLEGYASASLSFDHTSNKGAVANMRQMQTLWIADDYVAGSTPSQATWIPLAIPVYPAGTNWNFVNSGSIAIPAEYLKPNVRFAFKYVAATAAEGSCWEVKNVQLDASCAGMQQAIEAVEAQQVRVYALNGCIYTDGTSMRIYNLLGSDVTHLNGALQGVYVVCVDDAVYKVVVR